MRCPSLKDLPPPPPGKSGWPWTEESPYWMDESPLPRVGIVTPSYNQAQFIEETIRSVLLQGYPDLEYIIMDGGSTDGSVDIISRYEPWLVRWVSESDQGQTHAINKGWGNTTGEILAYLNSDDYYLPGAITAAVKGFNMNPQAGMVYGSATVVDQVGNELRTWKAQTFNLRTMLTAGSVVPQPATFFAKNALKSVGYLDEQWHMIMDYELCIRMGLQLPAVCLPITLAKFRDHLQSKTHSQHEKMAGELVRWLSTFSPLGVPPIELRAMKQIMCSRIHYEWALNYLARDRKYAFEALLQLIKSISQYSLFAMKRPIGTAYILKEISAAFVMVMYERLFFQKRPNANNS